MDRYLNLAGKWGCIILACTLLVTIYLPFTAAYFFIVAAESLDAYLEKSKWVDAVLRPFNRLVRKAEDFADRL